MQAADREHGGGGVSAEWQGGMAHPITDPFKTLKHESQVNGDRYSMDDMTMALGEVVGWITNNGKFQRRGVFSRAMTLSFLMEMPELKLDSQMELSRKLNLSRSQTNSIVRDFTNHFGFATTKQRKIITRGNMKKCRKPRPKDKFGPR